MRGIVYAVAAIAAVGIMYAIATMPQQSAETASPTDAAAARAAGSVATSDAVAATTPVNATGGSVTLAVPEMHCEVMCYPKVKQALEDTEGVEMVELAPQKEEGMIDNRQVIVKYKPGFDVNTAIERLTKEGYKNSELVQ
jgi:copper chaperone CopZ